MLLFGEETFTAAQTRLDATLHDVMARHPHETIAAVSHGTVMALWLAPLMQQPAEHIWQALGMPAYAVIDWPQNR
ncbi:histidine phosphatase family protein [bacterium]|nr:histidine phosphatase family protein [bacterium]